VITTDKLGTAGKTKAIDEQKDGDKDKNKDKDKDKD